MAGNSRAETRILFIIPSRIGDTLIATPTIKSIAIANPMAEITVYTHPKRKEILKNISFVHRIKSITKFQAKIKRIFGRRKYEYAFVFENDITYTKLALRIAKKVISFDHADSELNNKLYMHVKKPGQPIHAILDKALLAELIGARVNDLRIQYQVTDAELSQANSYLRKLSIPESCRLIGLQAISFKAKEFRNWPIENFIKLCKQISYLDSNVAFLFFGSKEDYSSNKVAVSALNTSAFNLAGLGLRETAAIMKQCNLLIGVDTGPTHIMGSMNIPMVGIYHCLMPSTLIAPLQHPCFEAVDHYVTSGKCSAKSEISDISVDAVYNAVLKVLRGVRDE